MEITTLIKWNGLVYALYYGVNLAYDYLRSRNRQAQESIQYSYKDLLEEAPVRVEVSDPPVSQGAIISEIKEETDHVHKVNQSSPVTLEGPVEDQGIPSDEFLQNARSFSSNINF